MWLWTFQVVDLGLRIVLQVSAACGSSTPAVYIAETLLWLSTCFELGKGNRGQSCLLLSVLLSLIVCNGLNLALHSKAV